MIAAAALTLAEAREWSRAARAALATVEADRAAASEGGERQ